MVNSDQLSGTTGTSAVTKYKTTPAQDKKAWLIYMAEILARLIVSGGASAALTRGYDATENTPISEKEVVAAIMSNVVFFALDNSKKGLLDNQLRLTRERPQTPMQVLQSIGQAIAVFVLTILATYAIKKAGLSETLELGLIVLAANFLKASVEKVVNHFLYNRPVVLLEEVAITAGSRPMLDNQVESNSSELGLAGGNASVDERIHSDDASGKYNAPYGELTDGSENKSPLSGCWATLTSLCSKGDHPHGTISAGTRTNPLSGGN